MSDRRSWAQRSTRKSSRFSRSERSGRLSRRSHAPSIDQMCATEKGVTDPRQGQSEDTEDISNLHLMRFQRTRIKLRAVFRLATGARDHPDHRASQTHTASGAIVTAMPKEESPHLKDPRSPCHHFSSRSEIDVADMTDDQLAAAVLRIRLEAKAANTIQAAARRVVCARCEVGATDECVTAQARNHPAVTSCDGIVNRIESEQPASQRLSHADIESMTDEELAIAVDRIRREAWAASTIQAAHRGHSSRAATIITQCQGNMDPSTESDQYLAQRSANLRAGPQLPQRRHSSAEEWPANPYERRLAKQLQAASCINKSDQGHISETKYQRRERAISEAGS